MTNRPYHHHNRRTLYQHKTRSRNKWFCNIIFEILEETAILITAKK